MAESRENDNEGGFLLLGEIPNRNILAKEWSDSDGCRVLEDELHEVSSRLVYEMQLRDGGSNDTQEGEPVEEWLIRVDHGSDSSSTEDQ